MLDAILEFATRFLVEFLFYTFLYGVGWVMLKAMTLGRYPPHPSQKHNRELVALFPVAAFFVGATIAFS
ncbi:hypothetical protein [Denitromonas halophila]|uniref:Uncharacterized protein n=1 Tax=Denitromonas halophila TaxID=1629404 RepID=A0A557QW70_9RHOO|nr:hypothetical protein [Denitromonas halophila]TVO57162.1 hypothetical protein FHP91_09710 [Denitromonas halophila]